MASKITTHILDLSRGKPAAGVSVRLEREEADGNFKGLGEGTTDQDGRNKSLLPDGAPLKPGTYRLRFETAPYFKALGAESFYPYVEIFFDVKEDAHHHVPLLLSPYGYSTYRGS
jgi:5-hydroxyisourate hydrolase